MSSEPPLIAALNQPTGKVTPPGAVWSLVLGILSLFCLWLLGSIPAIILGALSIKKAKANPDTVGGEGLALAGIITGAIGIFTGFVTVGIIGAVALPSYMSAKLAAEESIAMQSVREVAHASLIYSTDHTNGEFPDTLNDLIPKYISDDSKLSVTFEDGTSSPIQYRKIAANDYADEPMLLLKLSRPNRYILGYRDGSAERISKPLELRVLESFEQ